LLKHGENNRSCDTIIYPKSIRTTICRYVPQQKSFNPKLGNEIENWMEMLEIKNQTALGDDNKLDGFVWCRWIVSHTMPENITL
jgi:hypothetical protein